MPGRAPPLTAGHVLIRLSNPAMAFDHRSAADWLLCHNAARAGTGRRARGRRAARCCLRTSWHAHWCRHRRTGGGVLHAHVPPVRALGRRDRSPRANSCCFPPSAGCPWHRKSSESTTTACAPPCAARLWSARSARETEQFAAVPGDGTAANVPLAGLPSPAAGDALPGFGDRLLRLRRAAPYCSVPGVTSPASDHALTPGHLLALAAAVQELTDRPGVTGLSCVVPDPGAGPLEVHALGRSAGESVNP